MDFRITEEQQLLLESVDQFLDQCVDKGFGPDYWKKCWDESAYPTEYYKALMDSGLGLLGIPEEHGGTEVDLVTMCLVDMAFTTRGFNSALGSALTIDDMLTFGSPEQIAFVSGQIATGRGGFSLAFTEPGAGSDNSAMTTTATKLGDGTVRINGRKSFISNGDISSHLLLMVRDAEPKDPKRWASMYFVPIDTPGISFAPMHKIGWRTLGSLCEVGLDNVIVPESALVGEEGNGFIQLMKNFEMERLVMAAGAYGLAQRAMNLAAAYANERIAFGKPIGSFQLIQKMLVESEIKLQNMRNFILKTAWEKDNGISIRTTANLVKYYCARAAQEVIDDCLQIFGGIGYTEEAEISRLWRDIRAYRIGGGTDQIMIHAAGRQVLKQYAQK